MTLEKPQTCNASATPQEKESHKSIPELIAVGQGGVWENHGSFS
jgi:hypothetical protein